jgi:hypothetical protein
MIAFIFARGRVQYTASSSIVEEQISSPADAGPIHQHFQTAGITEKLKSNRGNNFTGSMPQKSGDLSKLPRPLVTGAARS